MKKAKYRMMNKRGNFVLDMGIFAIMAFVILLTMYVVNVVWGDINTDILAGDPDLQASPANSTYSNMDGWISSWGFIFFFMIAGIIAFIVISAQAIDTHPAYLIVAIFALIVLVMIMASLSNGFNDFTNDASFTDAKDDYSLANNVILYLPIFLLLLGGLVLVLLYGKI